MAQKYRVALSDGRTFDVESEGGPPSEADVLAALGGGGGDTAPGMPFTRRGGMTNPAMVSDFRTTNEVDAQGNPVVRDADPNTVGTFLSHVNPLPVITGLGRAVIPEAVARVMDPGLTDRGAQQFGPINTIQHLGAAAEAVYNKALASYQRGDYGTAARHLVDYLGAYLGGTVMDEAADAAQRGQLAAGAGDAVNLGLQLFGPKGVTELSALRQASRLGQPPRVPVPGGGRLTAQELASNAFAQEQGIPLDAATATGNRWALAAQKRVANSMGGEATASDLIRQQQQGLTAAGQRLAGQVAPQSIVPEQAGAAVPQALRRVMGTAGDEAAQGYGVLAGLEADPRYAAEVPAPRATQAAQAAVAQRMRSALGYAPTAGELSELRRMAEEMGAMPYVARTWNDLSAEVGKRGNAAGGAAEIVAGAGGAPVYDDILKSLRSPDYVPTRNHVERMIRDTLDTGQVNEVSRAAFDVAQRRLAGDPAVTRPTLPPSAGEVPEPPPVTMGMPVALKPLQDAMRPAHARLMAEAEVAPLMGSKAEAARILSRLMQSPEYVPASVADGVLGELKTVARTDVPELRSVGQGIAAQAVKTLSQQVDEIVSQVPGASDTLREARAATVRKYEAAAVFKQLRENPGEAFKQLTAPGVATPELLRAVQAQVPDVVPQLGRAKLQQWLDLATERGRFQHTDKLYADWQKLDPATKELLYPGLVSQLDDFFLLAKRIGENPNPSGTAHTLSAFNVVAQLGTYPLAKLLYTPTGVRALTAFLKTEPGVATAPVSGAAREAAWAQVAVAARQAGVPVPLRYPQAASAAPADARRGAE